MSSDGGDDATVCPSCGARVDDDDRFCSACGTALSTGRAGRPDPTGGGDEASDRPAPDGAASDGPTADDGTDGVADAGAGGRVGDGERVDGAPAEPDPDDAEPGTDDVEPGTDDADDDPELEPWQKRCPECGAVLVAQAVRCTDCGASQPDATPAEGSGETADDARERDRPADGRAPDPDRPDPARDHYRERRRPGGRGDERRAERPAGERRTTDVGDGEVQYERERRGGADEGWREPRSTAAGYRERERRGRRREPPRREPPRREPPRREPRRSRADRDPEAELAERQSARRADDAAYEPTVPSSRWWVGVLLPAVLTVLGAAIGLASDPAAVAAGDVPWVGDAGGLLELGVVLTPTLAPFALYFDRKYVAHETGRLPSAAYFLVAVPYLNLVVTGLYLWWRQQWLSDRRGEKN